MATAELAAALPAFAALVLLAVGLVAAAAAAVRCQDAAQVAARSVARGDSGAVVLRLARLDAPPGAAVTVGAPAANGFVRVRVTLQVHLPGLLGRELPGWTVSADAVALAAPA